MKKLDKKNTSVAERRFGVILENIDSNVKQVLEGHVVLDKKINEFYGEFVDFRNEANWKFEHIIQELKELREGRVSNLEKRMQILEKKVLL